MGLDTTHDCWHGAYSSFMRWRVKLHAAITGLPATHESLEGAWARGDYEDQSVPINVLMNHSDCDGEIPADMCIPLGDKLCELLIRLPNDDAHCFELTTRGRTLAFIGGLYRAGFANEPVEFH